MAKLYKVACRSCKTPVYRSKGRINENLKFHHNFYCSRKCEYSYKTKRQQLFCENPLCGRDFVRQQNDILIYNYCSRSCAARVNNQKFPKRKARLKVCANGLCGTKFKKELKYCSAGCRAAHSQNSRKYNPDQILSKIRKVANKLKRAPAKREMGKIADAAADFFGSWNNAVTASGLKPNRSHSQRMYRRMNTRAMDGHLCDSVSEAIIDNWFVKNRIFHDKNVPYPETKHRADWRIENVFVEYFGLAKDSPRYDRSISKKREICRKHKINLIEIYAKDLYPKIRLERKLKILKTSIGEQTT